MSKRRAQQRVLDYYEQLVFCWSNGLSELERRELAVWESFNLPRGLGTSDWPGWEKHIGKPPHSVKASPARRLA